MERAIPAHIKPCNATSDARLAKFITAWKDEFCEELSEGEARVRLGELVEFYFLLGKPAQASRAAARVGFRDMGTGKARGVFVPE